MYMASDTAQSRGISQWDLTTVFIKYKVKTFKGPEGDITDIKHFLLEVISSCATMLEVEVSARRVCTLSYIPSTDTITVLRTGFSNTCRMTYSTRNLFYPNYASHQDMILQKKPMEYTLFFQLNIVQEIRYSPRVRNDHQLDHRVRRILRKTTRFSPQKLWETKAHQQ